MRNEHVDMPISTFYRIKRVKIIFRDFWANIKILKSNYRKKVLKFVFG